MNKSRFSSGTRSTPKTKPYWNPSSGFPFSMSGSRRFSTTLRCHLTMDVAYLAARRTWFWSAGSDSLEMQKKGFTCTGRGQRPP